MKKQYLFLLLLFISLSLNAQVDTKGTDFWLTFGKHYYDFDDPNLSVQIRIVGGDQTATGTIYFTNLLKSVPFSVPSGQVYTYVLDVTEREAAINSPGTSEELFGEDHSDFSNLYSEMKTNQSIHILSDVPVTIYALIGGTASTDATNVLPITALGTNYYQISYMPLIADAYAVIATKNNTRLYHNGTLVAMLNTGEVYYRMDTLDMTGVHITADKPVALFSVSICVNIPTEFYACDNLFQQLPPVNTWGTNFFAPVSWLGHDVIRIVASQDNTTVTFSDGTIELLAGGQPSTNLNTGEFLDLIISLDNAGSYIQADKPVGVCAYLTGEGYNVYNHCIEYDEYGGYCYKTDDEYTTSDPAMAWLPPVEQLIRVALIAPFIPDGATELTRHFFLVVTPTATKDSTRVSISNTPALLVSELDTAYHIQWYDNAAAGMSFFSIELFDPNEACSFINMEGKLVVMGYGTGDCESYYYCASAAMRTLDVVFYGNEIHYQELPYMLLDSTQMHIRATIMGDVSTTPGHVVWYIDDTPQTQAQDSISWFYNFLTDGIYTIRMEVLMNDNITWKSIESAIRIGVPVRDTVCPGTTFTFTAQTVHGGAYPKYLWFVNDIAQPNDTTVTFVYTPLNSNIITCRIISDMECAQPDTIFTPPAIITMKNCKPPHLADIHLQVLTCYPNTTIDVLANDTMIHCSTVVTLAIIDTTSVAGTTANIVNHKIEYTRAVNFVGRDTLQYSATCGDTIYTGTLFITIVECPDNIDNIECYDEPPALNWNYKLLMMSPIEDIINNYSVPMIGDIDNDGKIEIIVPAASTTYTLLQNIMYIFEINGTTMIRQQQLNIPYINLINNSYSIANVDGGAYAALFIATTVTSNATPDKGQLIKYIYNGSQYVESWRQQYTTLNTRETPQPMIVDFNNDGIAEILVYDKIFNARTGDLLVDAGYLTDATKGFGLGGHAVSGHPGWMPTLPHAYSSMMAIADIDGDGIPEVIGGNSVYKVNIVNPIGTAGNSYTLYQQVSTVGHSEAIDGATAVADMTGDGQLDVIVTAPPPSISSGNAALYIWNPRTGKVLNNNIINNLPRSTSEPNGISIAFIGDIDDDGMPEICLTAMNTMRAYDYNPTTQQLTQKWSRTTGDGSGATTMVMFDFDQDRRNELVYRDQNNLRIMNGTNGSDKFVGTISCYSSTANEYPVVVDINNDGAAEIVVTGSTTNATSTGRIMVFSSQSGQNKWAPTRKVWNQFAYNVVNVNNNLTIPNIQMNPARFFPDGIQPHLPKIKQPFNGYLMQQTLLNKDGDTYWSLPNIVWTTHPSVTVAEDSAVLAGCIKNTGAATLQAPIYITYYKNDTATTANIIARDSISQNIKADSTLCFTFTIKNISSYAPITSIWVSVNDKNGVYPYQQQCMVNGRREADLPNNCHMKPITSPNVEVCKGSGINICFTAGYSIGTISTSGLPAGVTASWNSAHNTLCITGTVTEVGTFNYTLTPNVPCTTSAVSGTITVTPKLLPRVKIKITH